MATKIQGDFLIKHLEKGMKKRLFQYAVVLHKFTKVNGAQVGAISTSSVQEYEDSELIIEPTFVMAKSEKDVVFKVTRLIKEEHASDPDNVEILIRNF